MFSRLVAISKQIGVVAGAATVCGGLYMTLGLPMPVSQAAVDARINAKTDPIASVMGSIKSTQVLILGDLSTLQRQQLRNEKLALENAMGNANAANKVAFNLRLGQIADELVKLDRRDEQVLKQLEGK